MTCFLSFSLKAVIVIYFEWSTLLGIHYNQFTGVGCTNAECESRNEIYHTYACQWRRRQQRRSEFGSPLFAFCYCPGGKRLVLEPLFFRETPIEIRNVLEMTCSLLAKWRELEKERVEMPLNGNCFRFTATISVRRCGTHADGNRKRFSINLVAQIEFEKIHWIQRKEKSFAFYSDFW